MEGVRIVLFDVMRKINKCHRMSTLTITITVEPSKMIPPPGDSTLVRHKECHCVAHNKMPVSTWPALSTVMQWFQQHLDGSLNGMSMGFCLNGHGMAWPLLSMASAPLLRTIPEWVSSLFF
jgi:hypothetical protein